MTEKTVLFAEERRRQILELLDLKDKIFVPELSETFEVSTATIRTDLNELEKQGKLKRTHGGAITVAPASRELASEEKMVRNISNKDEIGRLAMNLIQDGNIVLLDAGTTTLHLAKQMAHVNNVTVVTNDMDIAAAVEPWPGINVIFVGGKLRKGFRCTVGLFANQLLSEIHVDIAFMASNAIDCASGVYTPDTSQAETKQTMMKCAKKKYLLADSSKFGQRSFIKFADIAEFTAIITDCQVEENDMQQLRGLTQIIAPEYEEQKS
ncbi:MAG: DeoR/GlpR transcriptional regulator [Spartobacteria bacterium]|nr:DeoR/GlpR transcriptional regulator [Spartobacteria bacterium]